MREFVKAAERAIGQSADRLSYDRPRPCDNARAVAPTSGGAAPVVAPHR